MSYLVCHRKMVAPHACKWSIYFPPKCGLFPASEPDEQRRNWRGSLGDSCVQSHVEVYCIASYLEYILLWPLSFLPPPHYPSSLNTSQHFWPTVLVTCLIAVTKYLQKVTFRSISFQFLVLSVRSITLLEAVHTVSTVRKHGCLFSACLPLYINQGPQDMEQCHPHLQQTFSFW